MISTLHQLIMFIGVIYVIGYIISLINKFFYRITGQGRTICLVTGLIGTPIHELSHAVMCLIFGHKIDDMKLYQIDDENGVLGYVNHSYTPRNIYQVIGNYFIGVAPIVVGSLVLYLLIKLMLPSSFLVIQSYIFDYTNLLVNGASNIFSFFPITFKIIQSIFTVDFGFKTVLFLIISLFISLHMNLSGADVKGSLSSLPIIILLVFVCNLILRLISKNLFLNFNNFMNSAGCYLIALLLLSLIFSLVIFLISVVGKLFIKRR